MYDLEPWIIPHTKSTITISSSKTYHFLSCDRNAAVLRSSCSRGLEPISTENGCRLPTNLFYTIWQLLNISSYSTWYWWCILHLSWPSASISTLSTAHASISTCFTTHARQPLSIAVFRNHLMQTGKFDISFNFKWLQRSQQRLNVSMFLKSHTKPVLFAARANSN